MWYLKSLIFGVIGVLLAWFISLFFGDIAGYCVMAFSLLAYYELIYKPWEQDDADRLQERLDIARGE